MQSIIDSEAAFDLARMRTELGLSRERMARLLDVSSKTIERWEQRGAMPSGSTDRRRLAELREIIDLGLIVYSDSGFRRFLSMPLPVFAGASALQMIERGQADLVLSALAADYDGLGA